MSLTTNNTRIVSFYKNNKHLNFESVNVSIIDLIENLSLTKNNIDSSSINDIFNKLSNQEKILNSVAEVNKLARQNEQTQIDNLKEKLSNISNKITENIKDVLSNNLSKSINDDNMKSVMENIVNKTKIMLNETIQNNVSSIINNSEERINNNLKTINETSIQNNSLCNQIKQEVTEHINNLSNSSKKGKIGETKLFSILTTLYPSGEVINSTTTGEKSGDFFLKRKNKADIIFENKDYSTNVGIGEIEKFIRDLDIHKCHGVFLSQQTGITSKENYEIDIHKNKILVYLHNVQYHPDIIKSSVEIIDTIDNFLQESELEGHTIPNNVLNEINLEFKRFIQEKQEIVTHIHDTSKKLISMIQKMNLSSLEKYLSTRYAIVQNSNFVCENCNKCWPTKRALSSHQKACKTKITCDEIVVNA